MTPDFNKKTIDTLAKRAAFKCSNPDCRTLTIGPNSDENKSTLIGEAAHILGARPNSKRFIQSMTDFARSEITNGIWLCRNCHKLIDTDERKYTSELLYIWREEHENYILTELGNRTDQITFNARNLLLSSFSDYPFIIRRLIIDKPDGWEYRLTAELMNYLNNPIFRKFEDLKDGLYQKDLIFIDESEIEEWIRNVIDECSTLIEPLVALIEKLNKSWGKPGEEGDINEIHHIVKLISNHLERMINFEEKLLFVRVPSKYEKVIKLLRNLIGTQAKKIALVPKDLEEILIIMNSDHEGTVEKPLRIEKTITFELPDGWEKDFNRELKKVNIIQGENKGCLIAIAIFVIIFLIIVL